MSLKSQFTTQIKAVHRGLVGLPVPTSQRVDSVNITIPSVDMNKTRCTLLGLRNYDSGATITPNVTLQLTSATVLNAYATLTDTVLTSKTVYASWEVIEYY